LPTKESSLEAHLVLCYDDHARFRANMLIITCSEEQRLLPNEVTPC